MEEYISNWNATWPFDYWYRQKYNIPFHSPEHLELSQIDIKLNYVEHRMADRDIEEYQKKKKDEEEYKKTGEWLRKREEKHAVSDELWDALDIDKL
jgi:hypothetical protein